MDKFRRCGDPGRWLCAVAFLALVLAACRPATASPLTPKPAAGSPTASATHLPAERVAMPATSSPTPVEGTRLTPCMSAEPQRPPEGFGIRGAIAYLDIPSLTYVLTGGTPLRTVPIPFPDPLSWEDVDLLSFSPDGRWLAYDTLEPQPRLGLLGHNGESVVTMPDASEVFGPLKPTTQVMFGRARWVNNELLQVHLLARGPDQETLETYAFLNPLTGEWAPGLVAALPERAPRGALAVSPDLTRALYAQSLPEAKGERRTDLVLWDYSRGRAIWRSQADPWLRDELSGAYLAEWSPDSSAVAYITFPRESKGDGYSSTERQVFLLGRNGEVLRQVTRFGEEHGWSPEPSLSWSPDGQFLAFGVYVQGGPPYNRRLYVYDVDSEDLVDQCILFGDDYRATNRFLIWSHDSQWIAYVAELGDKSSDDPSPLVIVDVFSGEHHLLEEHASVPAGWSGKFRVPEQ